MSIDVIKPLLSRLRMNGLMETLQSRLDQAQQHGLSQTDFLQLLLHLLEQRFVGQLDTSAQRVAQQFAAELAEDGIAASL
jgi:hypothetical protein